jgi:ABC-type multidrug transport system fused ATPase/permease subunit
MAQLFSTGAAYWYVYLLSVSLAAFDAMMISLPHVSLMDPQSADLDALRNQLSIVPQEPAMFSGTLRENIDPFVRYSDAAVTKAIQDCGLEGRSLDAVVGVSGENFSLGEKQLVCHCPASSSRLCSLSLQFLQVCLARVLLKQPALLALDEATSALDQTTEVLFQRVLEEKFQETTILCIAHRLETLRWCKTRIEMGTGKLLSISDFNPGSAASHH